MLHGVGDESVRDQQLIESPSAVHRRSRSILSAGASHTSQAEMTPAVEFDELHPVRLEPPVLGPPNVRCELIPMESSRDFNRLPRLALLLLQHR
ncbi:hypothetical protein C5E05_19455 [Pseudoclavibacter sp. AY1H1]|nr:hypothetical protein C5E05_19455 [Pseudoclavibacter sp. AY1H1]